MKLRKFRIKVQTSEQFGADVIRAWKSLESGRGADADYDLTISFPDVGFLTKVLSPERIRLMMAIRHAAPESIYALARLLGRAPSNVLKDVQELHRYGIVELKRVRKKGQKRESLQPAYPWDGFDIAV
jgi:predicted transcriptional regulator